MYQADSKLAKQGKESAEIYRQQGREDLYEQESGQVAVLEEFLPKQLDEAELTEALKAIIAEVGASSPKIWEKWWAPLPKIGRSGRR